MLRTCRQLLEVELRRRGVSFAHDIESGRHVVQRADGTRLLISLENLSREFERDNDEGRIARFVDSVLGSGSSPRVWQEAESRLYLALEPSDYAERSDLARAISNRVDRVPVVFDDEHGAMSWVTQQMIGDWSVTEDALIRRAAENLNAALRSATLQSDQVDDVQVAFIASALPFKAALILAPDFRAFVEPTLGWPLFAVAPARDFLYLWNAQHREFASRLGHVVVKEFTHSAYPLSAEVFELGDKGLRAIGEYPVGA